MQFDLFDYHIKHFREQDDPDYGVFIEEIPRVSAFGSTPEEALKELRVAFELYCEGMESHGKSIPAPFNKRVYSGNFNVRIPKSMHKKLVEKAEQDGSSLNQEVIRFLAIGLEHEEKGCISSSLPKSA